MNRIHRYTGKKASILKKLNARPPRPHALTTAVSANQASHPTVEPPLKRARTESPTKEDLVRHIAVLTKQVHDLNKGIKQPNTRTIGVQTEPCIELENYDAVCGEFEDQVSWDTYRFRRPVLETAVRRALQYGMMKPHRYPYRDYPEGDWIP